MAPIHIEDELDRVNDNTDRPIVNEDVFSLSKHFHKYNDWKLM